MKDMDCRDLVELVTAYLDHALEPDQARRVEEHLASCDGCTTFVDQARFTIAALGRLDPDPVGVQTRDRLLAAFRETGP
jgi:anti-sigma factor RsiW